MINLAHFDAHARTVLVEARRRTLMKHRRAIGSQHVLAALVDSNDLDDIMEKAGVQRASVVAHLGEAPPSAEQLLMELGIDLPAVRSTLPDKRSSTSGFWRVRRSMIWPLRITLDSPSASIPFDGTGRKVLEVAVWTSRRNNRQANTLDLLRGVLSDGNDPAVYALAASGAGPFKRLLHELTRLDLPSA